LGVASFMFLGNGGMEVAVPFARNPSFRSADKEPSFGVGILRNT